MRLSEWKADLERAREGKDAFFAEHWQSPINPQDRPRFRRRQRGVFPQRASATAERSKASG